MDGITINDKQYIFIQNGEDCDDCALCNLDTTCQCICRDFAKVISRTKGKDGVFKLLKMEK